MCAYLHLIAYDICFLACDACMHADSNACECGSFVTGTCSCDRPPVFRDRLCSGAACVKGPPVFRGHLYSGTACVQGPPVLRGHLYSGATCIQGPPVFRGRLCSGATCIQGPPVFRGRRYSGATCVQGPPVFRDHLVVSQTQMPFTLSYSLLLLIMCLVLPFQFSVKSLI